MELVGKVLGNRYEILEKIGSGGMATVYKAKCKLLNRKVAVKVLRDEFANDAEFIKRFQIEAQAAASLSHTNIVSIYDVGQENGLHYIVMELVEGKTLKEIINEKGRLEWHEAVQIASQIASGLEQAHKNHIVHRDIKPHNIIITKDGIAKVTDFGIAKAVSNSTINAYGSTIGSVHYFSPEHARGGYTDEKSDIYSLGVVLYEMITGKLPFNADTPVSIALKPINETPIEPILIVPDIPNALNEIILKAMEKEVNSRYASASAMNMELQKVLRSPGEIGKTEGKNKNETATQKVPIVGVNLRDEKEITVRIKSNRENEMNEEMGKTKKKTLTKKQALIKLIVYLIAGIGIVLLSMTITISLMNGIGAIGNKDIVVPSLLGKTEEEAKQIVEDLGVTLEVLSRVTNEEYKAGQVCYQNYTTVKEGTSVGVKISKGAAGSVLVPNVTELSAVAARASIEQNKLVCVEVEEASDTVAEGYIIRQEPAYNTEIAENETVTIYISTGLAEGIVEVPSVIGYTESEARKMLDEAKLLPKVQYISNSTKAEGVVLSQSPESTVYVSELSEVVIIINKTGATIPENESPKTLTVSLKNRGVRTTFEVKVEYIPQNGGGRQILYEGTHSRSDGSIEVDLPEKAAGLVRVYIDGVVDSEELI